MAPIIVFVVFAALTPLAGAITAGIIAFLVGALLTVPPQLATPRAPVWRDPVTHHSLGEWFSVGIVVLLCLLWLVSQP